MAKKKKSKSSKKKEEKKVVVEEEEKEEKVAMQVEEEEDVVENMDLDDMSDDNDAVKEKNDESMETEEKEEEEEEKDTKPTNNNKNNSNNFLDCFYDLSSDVSPAKRANAARTLLQHIYHPTLKTADATYTLKRLMNGLCSGRAGARQGYASALATFLRIGCSTTGKKGDEENKCAMEYIMLDMKSSSPENDDQHMHKFIRTELLRHTSPTSSSHTKFSADNNKKSSKKSGGITASVERDYAFGRLFGISSIVRSTILSGEDVPFSVIQGYAEDLIDLYHYKNWMREPASHGLLELVSSFSSSLSYTNAVMKDLITNVIVPQLLLLSPKKKKGEQQQNQNESSISRRDLLSSYNAEQVAIAIQLQTLYYDSNSSKEEVPLPYPLETPILCVENIPYLTAALKSTSHVVHPRCHLVWGCIWSFLTTEKKKGQKNYHELRSNSPIGTEPPCDTTSYLFRHVVVKSMLGLGEGDTATTSSSSSSSSSTNSSVTHEVKALALTIVQTLLGGNSSTSSPPNTFNIHLPYKMMEDDILQSNVITKLFLDTICASGGGGKKKKKGGGGGDGNVQHMLKPMALHVLDAIVDGCYDYDDDDGEEDENENETTSSSVQRRLSISKAILTTEPRFDVRTKTSTVAELLSMGDATADGDGKKNKEVDKAVESNIKKKQKQLMDGCLSYLEEQILSCAIGSLEHQALGYLDFLVNNITKKRLITHHQEKTAAVAMDRILGFLMVGAYFDCANLKSVADHEDESKKKNNKKKKKSKSKKANDDNDEIEACEATNEILSAGLRIQEFLKKHRNEEEESAIIPHPVRVLMSSRFMSLLSDRVCAVGGGGSGGSSHQQTTGKSHSTLCILSDVTSGWDVLEKNGAVAFAKSTYKEEEEVSENNGHTLEQSKKLVKEIQIIAMDLALHSSDESNKADAKFQAKLRCATGCAALLSALSLQLLKCGKKIPDDDTSDNYDDDDDDNDDVDEEIHEATSDLVNITKDLLRIVDEGLSAVVSEGGDKDGSDEEDEENMPLATLADLCVTSLSGSLASCKLTREMVKVAWSGGLAVASAVAPASSNQDVDDTNYLVDKHVMEVLLSSVCDGKSMEEEGKEAEGDDADESDDEGIDGEEDDDGNIFSTANASELDLDESMDREEDGKNISRKKCEDKKENEDESDEELDPERLQNLLLEDSDADLSEGEDGQLEHHAGADKALAQLIKMKQDARKAGQNEREKVELSNRLRCLVLLETLFSYSNSLKGTLVPTDVMLMSLLPLLRSRRVLEKTVLSPPDEKKGHVLLSEKKALMEHLTSLLKNKICKTRATAMGSTNGQSIVDIAMEDVFCEARRSLSAAHCQCCSASLVLILKALPQPADAIKFDTVYQTAVQEWSTRQTTRLNVCLFDDLLTKLPSIGKALLVSPIAIAAKESPKTYLKSESFRLMSSIFSNASNSESEESYCIEALKSSTHDALTAIEQALKSGELLKAKRARDVLKASEHVVSFICRHGLLDISLQKTMDSLLEQYKALSKSSPSAGVKQICAKLAEDVGSELEKKQVEVGKPKSALNPTTPKSSKKKKKSKKK